MAAKKVDIEIDQGATFRWRLQWSGENGVPVNLNGWTGKMQLRTTHSSPSVILEASSANGMIIIDSVTGAVGWSTVNIPASSTASLAAGTGVYDLELTNSADGFVKRLVEGKFTVSPEVTR